MKKIISFFLCLTFLISMMSTPMVVRAENFPDGFWEVNPKYATALDSSNYQDIIKYGWSIYNLFNGRTDETALNVVAPKLEQMGNAYEALGDYDNAVNVFKLYIPYAEKKGWKDGVIGARGKILALDFDIQLYTPTSDIANNFFTNGKYEPQSGAYLGTVINEKDHSDPPVKQDGTTKNYSSYIIYVDYAKENVQSYEYMFKYAKQNNASVQLAWNDFNIDVLRNIQDQKQKIESTANFLKQMDMPIYLRFACEMNLAESGIGSDPQAYVSAFRYVAQTVRSIAPNVAMVWAPNDISSWGVEYDSYYPGDEYVDWVGINSYTSLYFLGKKDTAATDNAVFLYGPYANPIARLKPIIEKYGSRKPIMLSETGVANYSNSLHEDLTSWAKPQLRRLYAYVPMVYPQVKAMYYFNVIRPGEPHNYALTTNGEVNSLYKELAGGDYFIGKNEKTAAFRYQKISDYTFTGHKIPLMTYAIPPKVVEPTIKYYIDGKEFTSKNVVPYDTDIDFSGYAKGTHTLTVAVYNGSTWMKNKSYQVTVTGQNTRIQEIYAGDVNVFDGLGIWEGLKDRFERSIFLYVGSSKAYVNNVRTRIDPDNLDVKPVVINDRTLVPVRFISEKLGADVNWDGSTSTATVSLDGTTVQLTLGSNIMKIDGKGKTIDVAADTIGDRVFIPLRALTEALGKKVFYDRDLIVISDIEGIFDANNDRQAITRFIEDLAY